MTKNDMTIKIGGEAGQGVRSSGAGFAKALARGGLHVFGLPDYMSRIRGGHNAFQLRIAEGPLYGHTDDVHVLIAMVPETVERHGAEIVEGGAVICDEGLGVDEKALGRKGVRLFSAPLIRIAEQAGSKVMANTAALGLAAGVTGYDLCGWPASSATTSAARESRSSTPTWAWPRPPTNWGASGTPRISVSSWNRSRRRSGC